MNLKWIARIGAVVAVAFFAFIKSGKSVAELMSPSKPKGIWGDSHNTFTDVNGHIWTRSDLSDKSIAEYVTKGKKKTSAGNDVFIFMRGSTIGTGGFFDEDRFANSMNKSSDTVNFTEEDMRFVVV